MSCRISPRGVGASARVLLALGLCGLVGVVWYGMSLRSEPRFEGKPLSFWLEQYRDAWPSFGSEATARIEAEKAIREIGVRAVPHLLGLLRTKDSPLAEKLYAVATRQRWVKVPFTPAHIRNSAGADGFVILGAEAKEAVPDLIDIFEQDISVPSRNCTSVALGGIGSAARDAIPFLLSAITNSTAGIRGNAVYCLGQIQSDSDVVVPALIDRLRDTNFVVRVLAVEALGDFGSAAIPAVPFLLEDAADPISRTRILAIVALGRIRAAPELAVPGLTAWLSDTNLDVRVAAADALAAFGSRARAAIPLLTEMRNDPNPKVVAAANRALETIQ